MPDTMLSIITGQAHVLYFKVGLQSVLLSHPAQSPTNLAKSVLHLLLSVVGLVHVLYSY